MSDILILGPGHSKRRIGAEDFDDTRDAITIVDFDPTVPSVWSNSVVYNLDMRKYDFRVPVFASSFDEVHAYEVLNLLPGDEYLFFSFWSEIWRVLKHDGVVHAVVPHWTSEYIYAYPAPQRVYTPTLLTYLDSQAAAGAKSDFSKLWPKERRLVLTGKYGISSSNGAPPIGFYFTLQKKGVN